MKFDHKNHSMIAYKDYIFAIGGYNSNKCEYFNINNLKWETLPDLNSTERQRAMLVIYNDYLYAFMGYSQNSVIDSVERINLANLSSSKWENVKVGNPYDINLKFYGAGTYELDGVIYFIGGKYGLGNSKEDYKEEIFSYSIKDNKFNNINSYYSGNLVFISNQFINIGNDNAGNVIDLNGGSLTTISISSLNNGNIFSQ